jgi:flavin reductase (DIM6/NTAB) family NADH-FMN oxidoreductase RutF
VSAGPGRREADVAADPAAAAARTVDPAVLREAFRGYATGVAVVTVGGALPHGMTANSFTSVSLEPPMVLVCVDRVATMHARLAATGRFGVSVLGAEQEDIARHFADHRRAWGTAQFDALDWLPGMCTGAPLIAGALAWFECGLWRTYDGGDHSIFVGELLSAARPGVHDALLFFGGRFHRLAP